MSRMPAENIWNMREVFYEWSDGIRVRDCKLAAHFIVKGQE